MITLQIQLPSDVEAILRAQAAKSGTDFDEYTAHLVAEFIRDKAAEMDADLSNAIPISGAEAVSYWKQTGVFGTWVNRTDITDSAKYARQLRQQAQTRNSDN